MQSPNKQSGDTVDPRWQLEFVARGPDDTDLLARVVAEHVRGGSVILLDGELAAGKTHFVKALVRALGSQEAVTSPTYTLVHIYDAGRVPVTHVDAYRLSGAVEYQDLGLDDDREDGVIVIEWGDVVGSHYPERLSIRLAFVEGDTFKRHVSVQAVGQGWSGLKRGIETAFAEGAA